LTAQYEIEFTDEQGGNLFAQGWTCTNPKSTIVITHGLAEHSDCYQDLAEFLTERQFNVFCWDLPGHGRSEGKRGYIENFERFKKCLNLVIHGAAKHKILSMTNYFMFGHSLGGLITTSTLLDNYELKPKGVCLSSPALGIGLEVPAIKIAASKLANQIYPKLTLWNEVRYTDLVHSEDKIKAYDLDPLRHDKISPPLFLGMMEQQAWVATRAPSFEWPLLLQVAGLEKIVSNQASAAFFENVPGKDKTFKIYNDSLHEIYNDQENKSVKNDLVVFLENHL
jgi:alpha-beta hydrolase superfamily lysophospholipase